MNAILHWTVWAELVFTEITNCQRNNRALLRTSESSYQLDKTSNVNDAL